MRWCVWVEAGRPSQVTCRSMTPAEGADPLPGQRSVGTKRSHPLWTAHLTATWWSEPITVARSRPSNWVFLCLRLQRAFQPIWTNHVRLLINRELKLKLSLSPQVQKRIQLFFLKWHGPMLQWLVIWRGVLSRYEDFLFFYVIGMTTKDKYLDL